MRHAGTAAAVVVLAGAGALVGVALSASSWLMLAGVATAAALLAVALMTQARGPNAGLTVLLVSAVIVPLEVPVGHRVFNAAAPLAALVCGGFALQVFAARRRIRLDRSRLTLSVGVFLAASVLAFLAGQYPWFPAPHAPMSAQLGGLALFLLSGGLLLAVGHQVTTVRQLRRLTWVFVGAGTLAVVTSFTSAFDFAAGRVQLTTAVSIGSGFWTWFVAITLGQALFNRDLSLAWRALLAGLAALALARGVFVAFSWASGWLPPLVAAGVLLLMRFPRATTASGFLAAAPALFFGGPALQAWYASEAYSSVTRVEALRVMWQIVQHNPWLGFGPANYYHYTQLFPILGWWVPFNSHNNYVDLVAQTGVIGLLAFGWIVVEVLRLALSLRRRLPGGFERAYLAGAVAGLAGGVVSGMLADWIVPFAYNIGVRGFRSSLLFWFFLGGVLALRRIAAAAPRADFSSAAGSSLAASRIHA